MAAPQARKEGILDAAQALVLKHGLRGTSMEAIARQAGVAKPTLYASYPDKPAVFAALLAAARAARVTCSPRCSIG